VSLKAIKQGQARKLVRAALRTITRKARAGDDLNPYLSRRIFVEDYTDSLFCDWGIYHMHLGNIPPGEYFVRRSDFLLFAMFTSHQALLIDIRPHATSEFLRRELLAVVHSEWPDALAAFRLTDIEKTREDVKDPKVIQRFRKAGINVVQSLGSEVFAPPGGGLTTARTSVRARIETDRLFHTAREASKWAVNHEEELRADMEARGLPAPKNLNLCITLHEGQFVILERTTGWACPLFGS
jgi:hypothetical protein